MNGNISNSTKRRKSKPKSNPPPFKQNVGDFNIPNYSLNSFSNTNIPEHPSYYFPVNYQQPMTTEPMSLPVYPMMYHNIPYTTPINGHMNTSSKLNVFSNSSTINNNDTNEYTSLPVGPLDPNLDMTDKRRYSDPGVPFDSDSSSNSIDERVVQKLTHQVNSLKESNKKLHRDMIELRIELNMLKQQQSGKHYDREYEPGMLAEVIREIRDAARVREDALLAKVKHMIEEKQFNMSQLNLVPEKSRNNDRLSKLEEQFRNITLNIPQRLDCASLQTSSSIEDNTSSAKQVIELEREALLLRRELQEARAKKEESDQKVIQLDKKLANIRNNASCELLIEDGKSNSPADINVSVTTSSAIMSHSHINPRMTLTGPVTDL